MNDWKVLLIGDTTYELATKKPLIYTSYYNGLPSKLECTFYKPPRALKEGNLVSLLYKEEVVFSGFVFILETTNNAETKILAYDQLRYLKNKETLQYKNQKASQLLNNIAADFSLTTGRIEDTEFIIPYRLQEEKTLLDIIMDSLTITEQQTGIRFFLLDKKGKLSLYKRESLLKNIILEEKDIGTLTERRSIDNSYNAIKLLRQDDRSGFKKVHFYEDRETQKKWGVLQLHKRIPVKN